MCTSRRFERRPALRPSPPRCCLPQLGNLCPRNSEEAKALIPSLKDNPNMTDEELDALLKDIEAYSSAG